MIDDCSAYSRAADIAAPARAANSRAKTSSPSVNSAVSERRSRTSAPAATPWPGRGVITIEPTGPKPAGTIQSGAVDGSIQREGTGGKPRSASARPGTSSGAAGASEETGLSPRTQVTIGSRCPRIGEMTSAASARCSAASCAVASMQRPRFSEDSRVLDAVARNDVRSRSVRRASRASW